MADEKMTIVDLRKAIAKQSNIDETLAGQFLTALFENVKTGLKNEKSVKINGLGTFKLQWVEPRKSVNISTGEPILIEGYQKLGFSPESGLKERINEPFAEFEAVELDENGNPIEQEPSAPRFNAHQRFDEQAEEIKDLLADLGQAPTSLEHNDTASEEADTDHTSAGAEEQEAEQSAEPIVEPLEQEAEQVAECREQSADCREPIAEETPAKPEPKPKKPFRPWLVALITILIFIALLVAGYFYLQNKVEAWADSLNGTKQETPVEMVDENDNQNENADENQLTEVPEEEPESTDFYTERHFTEYLGIETVNEGSRLSWIAKKYYGVKDYWVFIFEANQDKLDNPSNVSKGMQLYIPKLPDEVMQRQDTAKINALTRELHDKYVVKK